MILLQADAIFMKAWIKKILLTGCCSFMLIHSFAQVRFYATLSPNRINRDEYSTLRLVIENAGEIEKVASPDLSKFTIISGPNQESGMSNVNGSVSQYLALSFVIKPRKPGSFIVPSSTVVVAGKTYKSNPLTLFVSNASSGSSSSANTPVYPFTDIDDQRDGVDFKDYVLHRGEDVPAKVSKNMQVRLETDKTSCYVGEPVVATYKLYTRLKSESKLTKNPSFNGFSVVDMLQQDVTDYSKGMLGGRQYNIYTIRKSQLYPLRAGTFELEPAELENQVQFLKDDGTNNSGDLLRGLTVNPDALVTQTVTLKSKPVTVTVKPLPEEGKPASFNGAVGQFQLDAMLGKENFSTDETGMLTLRIAGSGNLQLITAPEVSWPGGIDGFEPKLTDHLVNTLVPLSGDKTFTYSFTVQQPGTYTIPSVRFSFFDPETGRYRTDSTKPLQLTVTKGAGVPKYDVAEDSPGTNISFLNRFIQHRLWVVMIVAVLIFSLLFFWLRKESKKDKIAAAVARAEAIRKEAIDSVANAMVVNQKNPLEETEACLYLEDCVTFYQVLNKELKLFIAQKLSIDPMQVNVKSIAVHMDRSGISNDTVLQLQRLLQEIEYELYTPFIQNERRHELYSRSHHIIQQINSQMA